MGSPRRGVVFVLVGVLATASAVPAYADTCNFDYDCPSGMLCSSGVCEPTASSSPAAPSSSGNGGGSHMSTIGVVLGVVLLGVLVLSLTWHPSSSSSARAVPFDESLPPPQPGGLTFRF
jgi:hypothetical protein